MPSNHLTIQDLSVLTLIAETPEVPSERVNQALRGLDGEAKRVGTAMKKQLTRKRGARTSGRSAQTAKVIFQRAESNGFVKHQK